MWQNKNVKLTKKTGKEVKRKIRKKERKKRKKKEKSWIPRKENIRHVANFIYVCRGKILREWYIIINCLLRESLCFQNEVLYTWEDVTIIIISYCQWWVRDHTRPVIIRNMFVGHIYNRTIIYIICLSTYIIIIHLHVMDTDIYVLLTFTHFLSSRIVHNKRWHSYRTRGSYIAYLTPFLVGKMKLDIQRKNKSLDDPLFASG